MNRISLVVLAAVLGLAACKKPPATAYYNRGGPESLLDVSSEVVNLSVADPAALNELSTWINQDQPTRAELYCSEGDMRCSQARRVLDQHGIPTMVVPSGEYSVALVYERILARDCHQSFVDNTSNAWNANHPAFGCAIAGNMVQHVSNKQQFVSPNITDVMPATQAVRAYERAYSIAAPTQPYNIQQGLTSSRASQ